mgnify:CR=1 FL=1
MREVDNDIDIPKLVIFTVGKSTHVVLDGIHIADGIEELKYSARNTKGELSPTIELLKISVKDFKYTDGKAFLENVLKK